ncbi:restriction endonuclease subunit S [Accumulibacter sp.]|uniref:restriction endonuclease subunit S n=1 Tax=Accumulibacter sp. TaxID=2053492 RepID=UPI0026315E4A|nr:restriction endonuclease subunit S [Accumulibacter sp.]
MAGDSVFECTVGDVAALGRNSLVGGPFGSDLVSRDYVPSGVPVVRGSNIGHGRWVDGEFAYVAPEKADALAANCAKRGDLVFTQRGTLGQVALVPQNGADRYLISQSQMKLTVDAQKADALFLYYVFTSAEQQAYIRQNAIQTGVPDTNLGILRNTPLTLPPLAEQKAIAAVLGAFDDKIELNRRMNATLEAMARALFQSWFVDFDPVRAKLDGRPPANLDPATAALFPEHLEDSLIGHIPKGWEVCSLASKIKLLSGGTPKTSEPDYWDGDIPWYSVKDAPSETDVWVIQSEKHVTKLGIENSAAQILPEGTTIISARGTVGKLALVGTPMAMNQSCYGVRGVKGYGDYFTYFALRQATADLQQRTHGTVFDTITRQTFETLDCIFPPANLTQAFDRTVAPLLTKLRANLHQSRTLATLRDTLLPKLLSGELSLPAAMLAAQAGVAGTTDKV